MSARRRPRARSTRALALVILVGGAAVVPVAPSARAAADPSVVQVHAPAPIYGAVEIHGEGWLPNVPVGFKPCDLETDFTICVDSPPYSASVMPRADGSFDHVWAAAASGCRGVPCRWSYGQPGVPGWRFVEVRVVDPQDQRITIDQRIPYAGGDVVTLRGSHWVPGATPNVLHCSRGGCTSPAVVTGATVQPTAGFDGSFATSIRLRRTVRGVDCYANRCWLVATTPGPAVRTASLDLVMGPRGSTVVVGYYSFAEEGDEFGCAPLILSKPSASPVGVWYHTFSIDAAAGSDFEDSGGLAIVHPGDVLGCARVNLVDDSRAEGTEMIGVHFDGVVASGAQLLDGGRDSYIFLRDDD